MTADGAAMNITLYFQHIAISGMPDPCKTVMALYKNSLGNTRAIMAQWVPRHTLELDAESDLDHEWSDDEETAYMPEGWYERINNWDEYSAVAVYEGEITHWAYLTTVHDWYAGA